MGTSKHSRPCPAPTAVPRSTERIHLTRLAAELTGYGVWARIIEDTTPYLRVSHPDSARAIEDVACERRRHDHAFIASCGIYLGTSDSIKLTAKKVAWLVGTIDR
ncbi:hypothetical protein HNR23_000229 [Nocardiopsis mwathae]|uniref:Uncharacterized protein n=1 Tax=Nocardiopsis mwathae TaxID=1472723 RepID=A0A7W9YDJ9_9ACTN|nr:hypothetical protein [Nocardiopsis mwathae]MBB6170169.1 hypothetical protein [Nocardiopsis mwathae]